ncbi:MULTISPECIES: FAD-dependent oxidoreductase [unclassified Crossiella]|uniref:FAD-dependent oxidoreductase n=1 Tax=unclassified Crossiella TaxID=2620835 RepID=UPI001FFE5EA2|nr:MULTISPECIES: GMC family oxidoreductase [unclassified Crossiella]MCK2240326.1 GMC family oxidoreductase [Crossiella sp. S99.2]MCK2253222.1 GMC family oxidoreductase [Crossiella sp. S99.1]
MAEHVDVVVVGTGFGGSVSAYRLAEAGKSVVVLERGRKYPPGSFARSPAEMRNNFWDPARRQYGLFDVWSFRGFASVVSAGVGGGSLIYANVLKRKDENWFVHDEPLRGGGYETWPISRAELDPHYDAVERMLTPAPYPLDHPDFSDMPRTKAMREAATALGLEFERPPLAVRFAARPGGEPGTGLPIEEAGYGNLHGEQRRTCRLCGECNIGCNDGAKNSLDHTYLSAAQHYDADIRDMCEVRLIRPLPGGGYEVGYREHQPDGVTKARTISCDRLVLGAGTFGTLHLLLRNRPRLPRLSRALGTRFTGNGDLLTFLLKAKDRDGVRDLEANRGPVITSAIRVPDAVDGEGITGRGHYIQDAGYPSFVAWLVEAANAPSQLNRIFGFAAKRLLNAIDRSPSTSLSHDLSELLDDGVFTESSVPLLGMGRDVPDGVVRMREGWLDVDWTTETSEEYFSGVRATMRGVSEVLGGEYRDNPMWLTKRIITVHPLGGAPMGQHSGEGLCDPYGEVYGYPGLYVADGSAMPGPVGPNPSMTIAAWADRLCDRLLGGGESDCGSTVEPMDPHCSEGAVRVTEEPAGRGGPAGSAGLSFTEEMTGSFALGETEPRQGELVGRRDERGLSFRLTIAIEDLDRFLDDPSHLAKATGWLHCDDLGGRLAVPFGRFNLLVPGSATDTRHMYYRLHLDDLAGNPLTLTGHKDLHDDAGPDLWSDTTTLYVRMYSGHVYEDDEPGEPIGAGVLHIRKRDFLQQLTTIRATGPDPLGSVERFGRMFLGRLWEIYGPRGPEDEE